jgi:Gpi18-like mannosyltransferase
MLSRLLFMGAGALAVALVPQADPAGDPLGPVGFLDYWAHWDGAWYAEIATEGYGEREPASTAFFPLYPMLVKVGIFFGGGPAFWGVLVSLVSTFFALFFVYRISEKLYDARAARAATLCLAFFPTAFFLNAAYTEALFLALTTGTLWAALVRRDFLVAGLLGALAAATRNVGVLLLVPLFFEWARHRREVGLRGVLGMALVPAGLAAYAAYLWARFGDPLVFARQQGDYWSREVSGPLATLGDA